MVAEDLGSPASAGAQNNLRYAFFPGPRRLAIQQEGRVRVYDTGEHMLSGFSQQQGGDQSLTFTSQFGLVRVADLQPVHPREDRPPSSSPASASAAPPPRTGEIQFLPSRLCRVGRGRPPRPLRRRRS